MGKDFTDNACDACGLHMLYYLGMALLLSTGFHFQNDTGEERRIQEGHQTAPGKEPESRC